MEDVSNQPQQPLGEAMSTATFDIEKAPVYSVQDEHIEEMAARYMPLTIAGLNDKKGLKEVHAARMEVRQVRINVEKKRKELKADALAYGRAVDAEAKRITEKIEPIESHLKAQEDAIEDEKQRIKEAEESQRREKLKARLQALRAVDATDLLDFEVENLTEKEFSEHLAAKQEEHREAIAKVELERKEKEAKEAAEAAERKAEQERLRKEREELEMARKKQEEELAAEKAKRDAELAEQKRVEDERIAKEQAELDRIKAEQAKEEARLKAELEAVEAKQREQERQAELEKARKEAAVKAELEAAEKAQREKEAKELRLRQEKEKQERIEAMRPDSEKIDALASDINNAARKYAFNALSANERKRTSDIIDECVSSLRTMAASLRS